MKTIISILLLLNIFQMGQAQYLAENAIWVYDQEKFISHEIQQNLELKNVGDTIINGLESSIISRWRYDIMPRNFAIDFGEMYIRYSSDIMYYYDQDYNSFYQVYDFTKTTGDTVTSYCPVSYSALDCIIDSIGFDTFMGEVRFWQMYSAIDEQYANCYFPGKVYKGIGGTQYLLPRGNFADPAQGGSLICYKDDNFGIRLDENNTCQRSSSIEVIDNNTFNNKLRFTQTNGELIIFNEDIKSVTIYNQIGQKIHQTKNNRVALSLIGNGVFLIAITMKMNVVISEKIFIN